MIVLNHIKLPSFLLTEVGKGDLDDKASLIGNLARIPDIIVSSIVRESFHLYHINSTPISNFGCLASLCEFFSVSWLDLVLFVTGSLKEFVKRFVIGFSVG
jgi:hypothetical protein